MQNTTASTESFITIARNAAMAAGDIIQSRFQGTFSIDHKTGVNNLVTEVDKLAETAIIDVIHAAFPDHTILSEEAGLLEQQSDYVWYVDPLDGTVNFAHGIPLCCVSIALSYKMELLLGIVYNPMMNEFFSAEKGKGATLNGQKIAVSQKSDFARACLVTGFPYEQPSSRMPLKVFSRAVEAGLPVRRLGSAAIDICWVACGRFDGFWEYKLNPWDVAAGYLIALEAGGTVSNFSSNQFDVFEKETLVTNGLIHEDLRRLILGVEEQHWPEDSQQVH
jgi:myo-inositol-1(or 4)-monophosphatase